jgi:DNA-binding LacI/PurR family transcriptional regulator
MNRRDLASRLKAAFSRQPRPTAIFAHDDYLASYVYASLGELGILAGRLLLDLLKGEIHDVHVLKLKQQLARRGTCARPAWA